MPTQIPVLVVDDDPNVVDLLSRAAVSAFPQILFTPIQSFTEAVTYLDGLKGEGPRLVLLDIYLQSPESGFDFLDRMRQHPQGRLVPIIVLTSDRSREEEAYSRGANAYTVKPDSFMGYKRYVQQLGGFWFNVATLPKLRFNK